MRILIGDAGNLILEMIEESGEVELVRARMISLILILSLLLSAKNEEKTNS